LGNFFSGADHFGAVFEFFDDMFYSQVDTTAEVHGVHASSYALAALDEDGTSEDSGGGGTVTSDVISGRSNLLDKGSSYVLEPVTEFNGFGYSDTIFGDLRASVRLLNDDVSALGAEGDLDGVGELLYAS
jgi:hypothetical protein